jgi:periplasmic protein TonB
VFDNLPESGRRKKKGLGQTAISFIFHGLLIYAAVKATAGAAETLETRLKDTTMVFLEDVKPAPPPPPQENQIVSANPPPQGFQTVVPPTEIPTEIPPVNLNERFDPKDFTGKGAEGGIAAGVAGGTGAVPTVAGEVFLAAEVQDVPTFVTPITPRYPPAMQAAGIPGRVTVQYVVDTTGHMEPESFKAMSSTNPAFVEPAREALLKALFRPGRANGKNVRVLVQQNITFKVPE